MKLPEEFEVMMKSLLGDEEAHAFFEAMKKSPVVSVRRNSRKNSDAFSYEERVPWCETGRYLKDRPVFTLDPLLHAGAYYVQDASSMIHYEVIRRIHAALKREMSGREMVLSDLPLNVSDLCAAPGGKTTAMIDALPDGSRITANEYMPKRATILKENLTKWGYPNVMVTNCDTNKFVANGDMFDVVAVDAPCSGEGMMRKDVDAIKQWSGELIEKCSQLQREILTNAAAILKPGGFLIYSTCTFNRIENEGNVEFAIEELGLDSFNPEFPEEWGIRGGITTDLPVYRFMPHITKGEGLFLAILRKPGDFEPSRIQNLSATPVKKMRHENKSYNQSKIKNSQFALSEPPSIEDILSGRFNREDFPEAEVNLETALAYLRRESVILSPDIPKGIVVLTYKGLPLGAAKNIGSRANNLYPKNWRILMR